jgi:pimeloyl-ACP methyl ester carboxylesterase
VVNVLDYNDLTDAVLVGHSYAGVVVTGVADQSAERLNSVVYLDSSPLPDGMSIADTQPPSQRDAQRRAVEQTGEGWLWPVPDRKTILAGTFGNANGLNDVHLELIAERATPHPYATLTSPLRLAHERPPNVRRAAVFCAGGGIDTAKVKELIAEGDARAEVFADEGWELFDLPGGHWPMFSLPSSLAYLLHEIAR